jgi:hypothetical protein
VVTDRPLETILRNPNVTERVAEWAVELQPFEISFKTTKVIKSKALAEFTAKWTDLFADEPPEVESTLPGEEAPGLWVMHFDGAFNLPDVGVGTVLTSLSGDKLFYAAQLCFKPEHKVSNNIAEYEGLLAGLRVVNALGIKNLIVKGDCRDPRDLSYTEMLCVLVTLATSDTGVTTPRPEHHRQAGRDTIGTTHLEVP